MDSVEAELRRRPVVMDTGALSPMPRRSGRVARTAAGIAVGALLATGAVAAGGWSVMTAARGSTASGQQSPLWYPTPPPVGDVPAASTTPAPPVPSPVAVIKPAVRRTHVSHPSPKPSPSADRHRGSGTGRATSGNAGKGSGGG